MNESEKSGNKNVRTLQLPFFAIAKTFPEEINIFSSNERVKKE